MNTKKQLMFSILALLTSVTALALPADVIFKHFEQDSRQNIKPIAIFDLDETTVSSTLRRKVAYDRAILDLEGNLGQRDWDDFERFKEIMATQGKRIMQQLPNEYDTAALFKKIGIKNQALIKILEDTMLKHYLNDGDLIACDRVIQGAVKFVNTLYDHDYQVYFVSSRYEDTQGLGTEQSLLASGLLKQGRGHVILRKRGEVSIDFKRRAFLEIQKVAFEQNRKVTIVAENEPENMNAMTELFPSALAIFIKGAFILNEPIRSKSVIFTNSYVLEYPKRH